MGTTGSTLAGKVDEGLPGLLARVRAQTQLPLAVGFGVATRKHFELVADAGADAVVVGSRIVAILKGAGTEISPLAQTVEQYCRELTLKGQNPPPKANNPVTPPLPILPPEKPNVMPVGTTTLPARFGQFGGQYVPEALVDCLIELEETHKAAVADPEFWREFESHYGYINRPSNLYEAKRLTEYAGGARIWFKREDLSVASSCPRRRQTNLAIIHRNHTGSHKLNNVIGQVSVLQALMRKNLTNVVQILLAKRIGKKRIIAETGAGQHGVATATACAKFGMECVVYMGAEDVRRQELNVFRMQMLGATVRLAHLQLLTTGSQPPRLFLCLLGRRP